MSNEEHMIFYGEKDIDYTKSNNYAFLNWDFDNSRGGKNNVYQSVEDNFVMGNAYMGNAVLGLFSILYSGNYCSVADTFIFPILFSTFSFCILSYPFKSSSGISFTNLEIAL